MKIREKIDLDALTFVQGPCDAKASLSELARRLHAALQAEHPLADVVVEWDARTSGAGGLSVEDDDGRLCSYDVTDPLRAVAGAVWEKYDWVIQPKEEVAP